ncbi:hypothetical protein C8N46_108167 [Kordia periserrulae]|uniref:Uncharacterized protein n=1 Tax=Kordia periserrulae TaxID=701523 RepID=A0A2T6BUW8_9FLAO|nr:hypothetical protein [Kordia periserrulae]PTX59854.1 hypothetical protein C8N46_108167 [Kordia periserrulae]
MKKVNFKQTSFIAFLRSEYEGRKHTKGILEAISAFTQLFILGIFNYRIKKSWNEVYHSIENNLLSFHAEVTSGFEGQKPRMIALLKNYGAERIEFSFNKAHIAVTEDSMYVFPYISKDSENSAIYYDRLETAFRIVYNSENKKDKFSIIQTIENIISMRHENDSTIITIRSSKENTEFELVFNQKIIYA